MQSDGYNSALSPVVYGDIALSINTHYITLSIIENPLLDYQIQTVVVDCCYYRLINVFYFFLGKKCQDFKLILLKNQCRNSL